MKKSFAQFLSAALFCSFAVLLIDPRGLLMPSMGQMSMLALAVIAFGALALFVVHEGDGDERDDVHRARAGRVAFLAGSAVLLLGIVIQSLAHALDPWLVWALVAMVIGKVGALLWSERYH